LYGRVFTLTSILSRKRKEIIHPHPDPLLSRERPRRERKIRERVFIGKERSNEINEMKEAKRWKSERSC